MTTKTKTKGAQKPEIQRQVDLILQLAEQVIEENENDITHPDDARRVRDQRADFESAKRIVRAAPRLLEALNKCEDVIGMARLQGKLSNNALSPVNDALIAAHDVLDELRGEPAPEIETTTTTERTKTMTTKTKTETKHTPGPWYRAAQATHEIQIVTCNDADEPNGLIAEVRRVAWCNEDESQANARLIAAAPAMLEALKEAQGAFKRYDLANIGSASIVNNAIANATGEGK
jgi:hypothetical protein